jgi:hypothetical protein
LHQARELAVACRYVVTVLPGVPGPGRCADLVYIGKGALIWMPTWRPGRRTLPGCCARPGTCSSMRRILQCRYGPWDEDHPRIRPDRSYFARCHENDTVPARGAVEWQWTLGQIINAVIAARLQARHVGEHAEPFWWPEGVRAAAWRAGCPTRSRCWRVNRTTELI